MVYRPALNGPFLFDDLFLPYGIPDRAALPLASWAAGVRPVLFLTFWLNHTLFGPGSFSYHAINLLIHVVNTVLAYRIARKLLTLSDAPYPLAAWLAGFAAAVFLLHPLQTESVAYIASRSESLCALFFLAAFGLFLSRLPGVISWPVSIAIVLLLLAACASKEQGMALVPALLLADYFWNPGFSFSGIRANWRLYLPIAAGTVVAGAVVWNVVSQSPSAGFHLPGLNWHDYFFTECRVFFTYLRLFILPVGQTVDYDVPISHGIFDHAALIALTGLLLVLALAVFYRKRWRLACFGVLLFVILLAPTSSFIPLQDPIAEHRMYLPVLALALVAVDVLRRLRLRLRQVVVFGAVCLAICAAASYSRNRLWGDPVLLWRDVIAKAPNKLRPYTSLALLYTSEGRCAETVRLLDGAPPGVQSEYNFLIMKAEAEGCMSHFNQAAGLFARAAEIHPDPHLLVRLGAMRTNAGDSEEALNALNRAIRLAPSSEEAYMSRGRLHERTGRLEEAASDYRHALELNPADPSAEILLQVVQRRLGARASAAR